MTDQTRGNRQAETCTACHPIGLVRARERRTIWDMQFFLDIDPPTATAQEQKTTVRGGTPRKYDPPKVKEAKFLLREALRPFKPPMPMDGPLQLYVEWRFPTGKSHRDGEWKITRPDTDNLQKGLKDCMTREGFWIDDSRVCLEIVKKIWSALPGIYIELEPIVMEPIGRDDE